MDITFVRKPEDNNWEVELAFIAFSSKERAQFEAFGGFTVDMGGSFSGATTFTLPVLQLSLPTQLPYRVLFSVSELGATEASARALLWETTIEARIQAAYDTWMTFDPTAGTSSRQVSITPS